jgi:hypothetical protein
VRLRVALVTAASTAAVCLGVTHPASAGLPQPPNIFNPPLQLAGALGTTDPSLAVDGTGAALVSSSAGPGLGCVLDGYSASGATAQFLGRPEGGTGCAIQIAPAQPGSPASIATVADGPAALIFSRSTNGARNFTSHVLHKATSLGPGSLVADPQPGLNGKGTVFALVHDAGTGLPATAVSIDGGLSYVLEKGPLDRAQLPAGALSGAAPVLGNLTARRDDTGLKLFTIAALADSAADTGALDTLFEAVGTVVPSSSAGAPPTVTWQDVRVAQAVGAHLNRPAPVTAVDSAGHVYAAWSDGTHVSALADPDGTQWATDPSPVAVDAASGIPGTLTSSVQPALVAGGNGLVDLAWLGASGGTGTADPHNQWGVYLAQTTNRGAAWTAFPVTTTVIHQGALCVAGDAACAASQQSPTSASPVTPGLQLALDQLNGAAVVVYGDDSQRPGLPSLQATRQCSGTSAVTGTTLAGSCAAPQQPPTAPAVSTCPGPQLTDLPGDAVDGTAQGSGADVLGLDLTQEVLNQVQNGDLVAAISVQYLNLGALPADLSSERWVLYWTFNHTRYYAAATVANGHQPVYQAGAVRPDGMLAAGTRISGTLVPGGGGEVILTIPAAAVGGPAGGAALSDEYAASYATFATGAITPGPVLVDRAPDAGFGAPATLAVCPPAADVPEVPAALLLPAVAGAGGAILFGIRRKRSRRSVKEEDEGGIPVVRTDPSGYSENSA